MISYVRQLILSRSAMTTLPLFLSLLITYMAQNPAYAQWGGGEKYPDLKPNEESLDHFKSMRFGMFVHWGPSSIRGTSSWGRGNHPYEFAPRIPINQFDFEMPRHHTG